MRRRWRLTQETPISLGPPWLVTHTRFPLYMADTVRPLRARVRTYARAVHEHSRYRSPHGATLSTLISPLPFIMYLPLNTRSPTEDANTGLEARTPSTHAARVVAGYAKPHPLTYLPHQHTHVENMWCRTLFREMIHAIGAT